MESQAQPQIQPQTIPESTAPSSTKPEQQSIGGLDAETIGIMSEMYRRKILPPDVTPIFEELVRRGRIPGIEQPEATQEKPERAVPNLEGVGGSTRLKSPYSDEELQKAKDMSAPEAFVTGAGAGLKEFGLGIGQAAAAATRQPELEQSITQMGMEDRKKQAPLMATRPAARIGKFVGQTAPVAAIPMAAPEGLLARTAVGAATGAGLGATSFVEPGESRAKNAAMGAAVGAGGALALQVPMAAANIAKGPSQTVTRDLAKKWGIRTTLAEDLEGMSSRTDVMMERVPVLLGGRKNWRYAQREEAHSAAKSAIGKYMVNPSDEIGSSAAYEANRN